MLLLVLTVTTHDSSKTRKEWISNICKRRAIYTPVIIHIYDTSTDIGVLILWGNLAIKERNNNNNFNVNHIDMQTFFIFGCVFVGFYRLCSVITWFALDWTCNCNVLLAVFDLTIFKVVYNAYKNNATEITEELLHTQVGETVTESVPQVVLQSVFIVRTWVDNEDTLNDIDRILIVLSIIASLLSIANKIIKFDKDNICTDKSKYVNFTTKCNTNSNSNNNNNSNCSNISNGNNNSNKFINNGNFCVSVGYIIRVLWRVGCVTSRVCIYVLVWSVMGGISLAIYFSFEMLLLTVLQCIIQEGYFDPFLVSCAISTVAMSTWKKDHPQYLFILRIIDNMIIMAIITVFSLFKFECSICHNSENRSVYVNDAVLVYLIIGWIGTIISILTFTIAVSKKYITVVSCFICCNNRNTNHK